MQIASHYCGPKLAKRLKVPDPPEAKIRTSELATKESTLQRPSPSSNDAASEGVFLSYKFTQAGIKVAHPFCSLHALCFFLEAVGTPVVICCFCICVGVGG